MRVADVHARTALRSCPAAFSPSLLWDPVAVVWPSPQRTLLTLRGLGAAAAPLLSGLRRWWPWGGNVTTDGRGLAPGGPHAIFLLGELRLARAPPE